MFTTLARSLGQLALGQVGVLPVQTISDHDTEHGVAEELETLVGRQPTVLVSVGTVGQRKDEQLGVQSDAERAQQLGSIHCLAPGWLSSHGAVLVQPRVRPAG